MEEKSLRTKLIHAARTGNLTNEQYEIYLRLLEEDETFRSEVEWEEFLEDELPVALDAPLYDASEKRTFVSRPVVFWRYNYAIAAAVLLLLVGGWILFFYGNGNSPTLIGSRQLEFFSGDPRRDGQLGYANAGTPVGSLPLKWWVDKGQVQTARYLFCRDTLQIFVRQRSDTALVNKTIRILYNTGKQQYQIASGKKKPVGVQPCTDKPNQLIP